MKWQPVVILGLFVTLLGCTKTTTAPENSIEVSLRANLKSLDPALANDEYTNEVVSNFLESLLQYHYLKRPLQIIPKLATEMPKVSKDGLTHTFTLRPGIKFHDSEVFPDGKGRDVTAQDFIYSWKRIADSKNQSDGFWIFDGKIKGLNEWREKMGKGEATYDTPVEGFSAPDPHTIVIQLTRPYSQLHYVLAMAYTAVIPKEAVAKYGAEFGTRPVGTGPFKFESWIRGNKVVLVKNPAWRGETYPSDGESTDQAQGLLGDAGKALPFVDKLVFHEVPEDQPRWLNFMKGTTDFAEIPKDSYDSAIEGKSVKPALAAKGIRLIDYSLVDVAYISFNMSDPILGKNLNLRRALSLAYDTKTSLEKFYNNRGIIAHSPIPPGLEGYDPDFKNPWKEYDIEKAKALLKKAGYPEGKGLPILEYSVGSSATLRQMGEYAGQQFEKIGVKINIVANSWPQFQDRLRNRKSQIFGVAWSADYPDAENMLQLLYGKNVSPGPNNSNFENKEFDQLYEKAQRLLPGPERTELYKKMRDIFVDHSPWIPTVHRTGYLVHHGWINNLKRHKTISGYYKYLRVDLEKKKDLKSKL